MKKANEKERKVYVITAGCYSDYHICAVTLDENRAKQLQRLFDNGNAQIEEYIADETKKTGRVYEVSFHIGETTEINIDEYDGFGKVIETPIIEDWHYDCELRVRVRAKNEEHAMKIAQDEYVLWKAKKEGVV